MPRFSSSESTDLMLDGFLAYGGLGGKRELENWLLRDDDDSIDGPRSRSLCRDTESKLVLDLEKEDCEYESRLGRVGATGSGDGTWRAPK